MLCGLRLVATEQPMGWRRGTLGKGAAHRGDVEGVGVVWG